MTAIHPGGRYTFGITRKSENSKHMIGRGGDIISPRGRRKPKKRGGEENQRKGPSLLRPSAEARWLTKLFAQKNNPSQSLAQNKSLISRKMSHSVFFQLTVIVSRCTPVTPVIVDPPFSPSRMKIHPDVPVAAIKAWEKTQEKTQLHSPSRLKPHPDVPVAAIKAWEKFRKKSKKTTQ